MKSVRKRLTYANVVSSIALFLVVAGGTAFAATQLGKESVGTRQLKKEAVSLAKINGAAKSALKGATGPAGQKGAEGPKGSTGSQGSKGDTGAQGPKGDTGPSTGPAGGALTGEYPNPSLAAAAVTTEKLADDAVTGAKIGSISVLSETVEIPAETNNNAIDNCNGGTLLSVGYIWDSPNTQGLYVHDIYRFLEAGIVRGVNTTKAAHKLTIQLTCLDA